MILNRLAARPDAYGPGVFSIRMVDLPVTPPIAPMLAKAARSIPVGNYLYEPKWDGFRCIVFRDGDEVELGSRNGRPLTRYFPELVETMRSQLPIRCVLDGEVVVAGPDGLDFDALSSASIPRPRGCGCSPPRPRRRSLASTCWLLGRAIFARRRSFPAEKSSSR